jgi:hypothetical protein
MRLLRNPELFFLILVTVLVALGASSQRVAGGGGLTMGQPGMNTFPETAPGETTKLERAYPGAPPFVPHSVVGLNRGGGGTCCHQGSPLTLHQRLQQGTARGSGHRDEIQLPPVPFTTVFRGLPI